MSNPAMLYQQTAPALAPHTAAPCTVQAAAQLRAQPVHGALLLLQETGCALPQGKYKTFTFSEIQTGRKDTS